MDVPYYVTVTPLRHCFLHSCMRGWDYYGEIRPQAKIYGHIELDETGLLRFILLLPGRHRFSAGSFGLVALPDETKLPWNSSGNIRFNKNNQTAYIKRCLIVDQLLRRPMRYQRGNVRTRCKHSRTACLHPLKRSYWQGRNCVVMRRRNFLEIKSSTPIIA